MPSASSVLSPGSPTSLLERQELLRRAEAELSEFEAAIISRAKRLQETGAAAQARLGQVRAAVSGAQLSGLRDPDVRRMHARLQNERVGEVDVPALLQATLAAREAAVNARRQAAEAAEQATLAQARALGELEQRLTEDESALARAEAARALQEATPAPAPVAREVNQRSSTRVPLPAAVDLCSDSNLYTGFSTDISEGGVFVATLTELPIGTEVDLAFHLDGRDLQVRGQVRWTRPLSELTPEVFPGLGVQFLELPAQVAAHIRQFASEREPLFFPD
jgi:uncharacterized protein (TIGR02266 family)